MNPMTQAAILNQLQSTDIDFKNAKNITCENDLPIPVSAYLIFSDGSSTWTGIDMLPSQASQTSVIQLPDKAYLIWLESVSRAFVCVVFMDFAVTTDYSIRRGALCGPGEIGPLPVPTADILIPQDSTKVVVSCGTISGGTIVRYQYWHTTSDSYSLPPGDNHTYSVTTSSGLQNTSSEMMTIATSVSSSASAGWGPVSASISYSLSTSTTTMHSYTITEETTRYESLSLSNSGNDVVIYFAWQLMDVVEVYLNVNSILTPTAALVSARMPLIYDGPYKPHTGQSSPRRGLSDAEYAFQKTLPLNRPLHPGESHGLK